LRRAVVILFVFGGLLFPIATRPAAQTRRPPRIVTGLTDVIYAVRFSPDSQTLAIARGSRDDYRVELWDTATGALRHTIKGFDGAIWSLSFAPDGKTLVTASGGFHRNRIAEKPSVHDGRSFTELKWWDAKNGELKQRVEMAGEDLVSVAALYSPNGKMLAAFEQRAEPRLTMFDIRGPGGDADNLMRNPIRRSVLYAADLKLLDAITGDVTLKLKGEFSGGEMPVSMRGYSRTDLAAFVNQRRDPLVLSPDGQLVAAWNSAEIRLWSSTTGEELRKLKNFKGRLAAIMFAPDSRTLAGAITKLSFKKNRPDFKSEVRTWDVATGASRQVVPVTTQSASSLAFALNGQQLLIGGLEREDTRSFATLELADLQSGSLGKLIGKDEGTVSSIALAPNGGMLAFQTDAATVNLVDTRDWKIKHTFDANSDGESHTTATGRFLLTVRNVLALAFSSDGKTLAGEIEQGGIKLWDTRTGEVKKHLDAREGQPNLIEISSDAKIVAEVRDNETLSWRDTASGDETIFAEQAQNISALGVSSDGKTLAVARHDLIAVLDVATRKSKATLTAQGKAINRLAFSDDGKRLAASSEDGTIAVWSIDSKQMLITLNAAGKVTALRFAPGGKSLASASEDGVVKLWDLAGASNLQLKKHSATVNAIAFSPDGTMMATGGDDRTVIIWETVSGKSRRTLKGHDLTVTSLAFSPDGDLLAVGSGNASVVLWDARTGKLNRVLK
jgi:WD40 repeat protein